MSRDQLRNRLERLISLYQAVYRVGEPNWHADLQPPARDESVDRIERLLGRLLPEEARELYRWHDGGISSIAPTLRFDSVEWAYKVYEPMRNFPLPKPTNALDAIETGALFPVFNIEKALFTVPTTSGHIAPSSALYILLLEFNRLTVVAHSIRDFIDHLIREFEEGHAEYAVHGVRWTHDPYRFHDGMEPYGNSNLPG